MAKQRFPGTNSLVKVDPAGATAFQTFEATREYNLPNKTRAQIDLTGLEDPASRTVPGIEEPSQFAYQIVWDPIDAVDQVLDSLFTSQALANWQVEVKNGVENRTATFLGRVQNLEPSTVTGTDGLFMNITILRDGDIAYADSTPP